ncbi:MAG: hypothetical protein AABO41_17155 [Acidobacteriota bacterium]
MYKRTIKRELGIALLASFILVSLVWSITASAQGGRQYPFRLRLKLERTAVNAGETIRLEVELLDRNYNRVPNDRRRVVWFDQPPAGPGYSGSGRISPVQIAIEQGESSASRAVLYADNPGKTLVRANSEGLASDQSYLLITGGKRSLISRLFCPSVYADSPLEIEPNRQQVPANNTSLAQFTVFLSGNEGPASVKIKTNPPCRMRAGEAEGLGALLLTSADNPASFERVFVAAKRPGLVSVTAQILPNGPTAEAFLEALPPKPAKILFDSREGEKIRVDEEAWLTIRLVDADGIDITQLDHHREIRLTSPTDRDRVEFDNTRGEKNVSLPGNPPSAQVAFTLKGAPGAREIRLRADDALSRDLEAGFRTFTFDGDLPPIGYLFLIAAISGVVGGFIKDLRRHHAKKTLPMLKNRRPLLRILGNAPVAVVLGMMVFVAGRIGLVEGVGLLTGIEASPAQLQMMAMLLGVLGGFGGPSVLDRLLNRILPVAQRARSEAAARAVIRR